MFNFLYAEAVEWAWDLRFDPEHVYISGFIGLASEKTLAQRAAILEIVHVLSALDDKALNALYKAG